MREGLTVSANIDNRSPADEPIGIVVFAHLKCYVVLATNLIRYCCAN